MLRYITVDRATLAVAVSAKHGDPALTVPLTARSSSGRTIDHPVAGFILFDVIYPARYAADHRRGITNVRYALPPPDPWLVTLGIIMWEGIV